MNYSLSISFKFLWQPNVLCSQLYYFSLFQHLIMIVFEETCTKVYAVRNLTT